MADKATGYSVDEALVTMGFGKLQYMVFIYAGMGWVADAMEIMLLSFVGPAVKSAWNLSPAQESLITTVVFAGMLLGAYSWGLISDKYGRRIGFFVPAMVTSAAGLLSAVSPNYIVLLISRCLVGIGLGGGPVLFTWFTEFLPAPNRGLWLVIFSAFWTLGVILEASLAWIVMPRLGWRWQVGLSALPSLILLIFYPATLESPRYFCLKGKKQKASKVLNKIAKMNKTELPPGVLLTDQEIELNGRTITQDGTQLSGQSVDTPKWKDSDLGIFRSLVMLLSPELARTTLLLWVTFFGNAFSYYGLVLLTTELNSKSSSCGTHRQSHSSDTVNYKNVFIASFAEFPGLIVSALIVDRVGRKASMAGLFFLCCIFMVPLVVHQSDGVTTTLLFGARACISGCFTIVYIYAPEIYPTSVRTTGFGAASSMGRIGGMICPQVAVILVQGCHQMAAILLFIGVISVSAIAVLFFPLETKGLELIDSVASHKRENPKAYAKKPDGSTQLQHSANHV
ncbi:organic cation/carnitine transporter 7-like isoform X2 [Silene latifolia]